MLRNLNYVQAKAFIVMCTTVLENHVTCDGVLDMTEIFVLCALEQMAENKGITDYRDYPELAVQISHSMENTMRDYIEFNIDREYGPDEEMEVTHEEGTT